MIHGSHGRLSGATALSEQSGGYFPIWLWQLAQFRQMAFVPARNRVMLYAEL
jgi:hypothetical protein